MVLTTNLQELRHGQPGYFQNNYDAVITAAILLFGRNCVRIDMKNATLTIKDSILLVLHFSGNETKIYFDTYTLPSYTSKSKETRDFICDTLKANMSARFRFFDLQKAIEYLQLKKEENDFIKAFEG